MLFPRPPTPVGPRRAVAEMIVAYKQAAPILAGHVLEIAADAPDPGVPTASADGAGVEPPICFAVVYRLREYLAILRELLPVGMLEWERSRGKAASGRLSWSTRTTLALMVPLVGTPVFLLKKRRMPVCRFTVDGRRIVREAGGGRLSVAWEEVAAVHRLSTAWVIDKGRGSLPVPHRCLSDAQRAAFERLLLSRFGHDTPV